MISKKLSIGLSIILIFSIACGGKQTKSSQAKSGPANRGQATGYATIFDDDIALAKDRATDDAKSKLVIQILGETISGRSVVQDFELVSSIIEAKSFGLVKNDRIVKSWQEGNTYFVTVEGTVEEAAVQNAIQSILNTYGKPKFMVLVNEKFDGVNNTPGFTETEMIIQQVMGNSGFEFVDSSIIQSLSTRNKAIMNNAANGVVNENVQNLLLNDTGAEVLIIGTAETFDQSAAVQAMGAQNMKSKQAIVRLRAVDLYTGKIIASVTQNAPGLHIEENTASKAAIEAVMRIVLGRTDRDTGKFAMGVFLNQIVNAFVKAANERQIDLLINGLNYEDLKTFRNALASRIRGVKSVVPKSQTGTNSRLEIYFAGKTNDFADELLAKASAMGFNISITESFPNRLVINASKR